MVDSVRARDQALGLQQSLHRRLGHKVCAVSANLTASSRGENAGSASASATLDIAPIPAIERRFRTVELT